jgi:purine-nucleoside phosphorylase|uniref:Purine nucleoside phosphorylase n=1 Tax=candidate division WOR-3 bacterium TaxID=2052148 RepID=A0A7V3RH18_UNCW3
MKAKINETLNYLLEKTNIKPRIGIILGTGLGGLAKKIKIKNAFDYKDIPHFPVSTVEFHKGRLLFGSLRNKDVMVMQGRFHYYEGYSAKEITYPVIIMKKMGVRYLIISNAAGGLNPDFLPGDIMLITDHINLIPDNPLRGPEELKFGPRFPDMLNCYEPRLIKIAETIAQKMGIFIKKGIYVGVPGPNLETRAEYRFLRIIGADAVGMSTVPEVIMARYLGIKVLGISVITDMGLPDALQPASLVKILLAAKRAEPKLIKIVEGVVEKL